jgi:A/G-specific adenine glycosylase
VRESRRPMLAGRELKTFRKQLLGWFRQFQRDLPWRRTQDPYRIWLSEIMLQQTRVAVVIPYYERFLERFPDVRVLAEASEEEVLRLWSGLGYYSRARNLQKAAREIAGRHGGEFPKTVEDVLALSGIGRYTTAAILSIAFGRELAVLDGNVARVLARLGAVRGDLREGKHWQAPQESADHLLDAKSPGDWNQAMMELGATVCTPKSPLCLVCPVAKFCRARQLGIAECLPEKREKRATVEVTLAAAVFRDKQGRTLLLPAPRSSKKSAEANDVPTLVSKLWHFPTVAVAKDALPELRRFLTTLLPTGADRGLHLEPLPRVRHAVTYRAVRVKAFQIAVARLPKISSAKILGLGDLSSLPVSNLTRKIARAALSAEVEDLANG